jgi:O-antigen/teichoic acid export membrane protein
LFYYNRREYIPRLKWIDISKVHDILKLGGSFFIIQIATIVMFSISNMMIIQLLSPKDVSVYNVIFRLFSVLTLTFSIVITPYWSAFTEAHKKSDFKWIKKSIFNLHILLVLSIVGAAVLIAFHQIILDLWLGKNKIVPGYMLSIMIAVYSIVLNWSNIYSHFLNGIGKLRMQTIIAVIQAALVIPSCLFFTNVLKLGLVGVVLSMVVFMLTIAVLGPIVTYKKLNSFKNE